MPPDQPNVLQIVTDQQQARALGAVDSSFDTPNLDRLAENGTLFTDAYCTHAQCTPSRSSMVTGQHPHQTGCYTLPYWGGYPLEPDENPSVGRVMDDAGYDVTWAGKWHLGDDNMEALGWDPLPEAPGEVSDEERENRGHDDSNATARGLRYLDEYDDEDPFFMTVSWRLPHPRWYVEEEFADRYDRDEITLPESFDADRSDKPEYVRERAETCDLTEEELREIRFSYLTMVSKIDALVGDLLDKLEAEGLREETAVVFHSDHGDMQGAHGIDKKGCLPYEEIYRIPAIVDVPWIDGERDEVDDLVTNAAIPGTIVDAVGLDVPDEFEGGSLLPALRRSERPDDEQVFFEHKYAHWGGYPFRGVRTRRWKYVEHLHSDEEELYDLQNDPNELDNLAVDPDAEHVDLMDDLRTRVEEWWQATDGDVDDWVNSPTPESDDEV
jgi:choline-sulfatase